MIRAKITGTGMCVPERRVTNKDLEALMDTSDEWIRQRSGIVDPRWIEPGHVPADLAEPASRQALASAGLEASDVDCIVQATLSAQAEFPGTSFFLQERLGGTLMSFVRKDLVKDACSFSGKLPIVGLDMANKADRDECDWYPITKGESCSAKGQGRFAATP